MPKEKELVEQLRAEAREVLKTIEDEQQLEARFIWGYVLLGQDGQPRSALRPTREELEAGPHEHVVLEARLEGRRIWAGRDFPMPTRVSGVDQWGREEKEDAPGFRTQVLWRRRMEIP